MAHIHFNTAVCHHHICQRRSKCLEATSGSNGRSSFLACDYTSMFCFLFRFVCLSCRSFTMNVYTPFTTTLPVTMASVFSSSMLLISVPLHMQHAFDWHLNSVCASTCVHITLCDLITLDVQVVVSLVESTSLIWVEEFHLANKKIYILSLLQCYFLLFVFFLCLLALMNCIAAVFYQQTGTKIVAGFFYFFFRLFFTISYFLSTCASSLLKVTFWVPHLWEDY